MKDKTRKSISEAINWLMVLAGIVVVFAIVYTNMATFDPYNERSFALYRAIDTAGIKAIMTVLFLGGIKIIVAWKD